MTHLYMEAISTNKVLITLLLQINIRDYYPQYRSGY